MKVRKFYLATLLTCMLAVMSTLSMPCVRAEETVPFKATGAGTAVATSPTDIYITGAGKATHMGAIKIEQWATIDFSTLAFKGTYVLTGACGNTLYGKFQGQFVPLFDKSGNLIGFEIHGQFTIDGGTGELFYATGSGTCTGTQYFVVFPVSSTFSYTLNGTISYE